MKRLAHIAALLAAASAGYVADQATDLPRVLPQAEPPRAVAIVVKGPQEGFAGREYFFHAALSGEHGKPTWIVSPECDLTVNDEGTLARIRCDSPDLYTLTVTVGGVNATVAADVVHFDVVDLDAEIEAAVAAATATAMSEPTGPTIGQLAMASAHMPESPDDRAKAAGRLNVLANLIEGGHFPRDNDPWLVARGDLGELWRPVFDELEPIINELRASGQLAYVGAWPPVLREIAAALSE